METNRIMHASRVFLITATVCLTLGVLLVTKVVTVGNLAAAYVLLPIGAVFAGMYLIWRVLENEPGQSANESPSARVPGEAGVACSCDGNRDASGKH